MKKIDLVYLWVDGSDENWVKTKAKMLSELKGISLNADSIDSCRFQDNNELLYSLRSVEKNLPWINHIYIVTANQTPKWLNTENPKVTIISHNEIMDDFALPTFNACSIESYITKIPNLSEYFIYANDDMFFWNEASPELFFDENDNPIYQMGAKILNKKYKHLYGNAIFKAHSLIKEKFNKTVGYFPHHGVDPYRKSYIDECINIFNKEFDITRHNHFRDFSDLQRTIFAYYAIVEKNCKFEIPPKESYVECRTKQLKLLKKLKFPLACINSGRKTKDKDVLEMKKILHEKFPHISNFEKKKEINVCLATDNNYCQHLAACVSSILKNKNENEFINVYIIDGGIEKENKERLAFFEKNYDCKIIYTTPDVEKLKNCKIFKGNYISKAAYYRLLIPELLDCDKVIYLDCDTIVNSSLSELFEKEFNNNLVLGVIDVTSEKHQKRLNIGKYINSGVLLLNLKQMKKENTLNTILNWINQNLQKIELHDQDIINASINDRIEYIEEKFNVQVRREDHSLFNKIKKPTIIHFISSKKPWTLWKPLDTTHYGKKYFDAIKDTPWEFFILEYKNKTFFIAPLRIFYPSGFFKKIIETIFSIKKSEDAKHKIITILGIKFKKEREKIAVD